GVVTLSVTWPEPAEIDAQLIPQLSQRIDVEIVDPATDEVLVSDSIQRPTAAPWTVQKTYEGVSASSDAVLTANAYPNATATNGEVAQATGTMHIVIPANGTAYPLTGQAGDPIDLSLGSTVTEVQVTVTPASIGVGGTAQATATALNADNETVLVPGFDWSTSNSNISVEQNSSVTGEIIGTGDVIATETESGVSGSATVTVICVVPQIAEPTLTTDPDPMSASGGTATVSAQITDPRGVASATVVVTRPDSSTQQVAMTQTNGAWQATYAIPANTTDADATYSFAVVATNNDGCDTDAVAAGSVVVPGPPLVSGTVTRYHVTPALNGQPLEGVPVWISGTDHWTRTDADGNYSFRVAPGSYTINADGLLYNAAPGDQTAKPLSVAGSNVTVNFQLQSLPGTPPDQGAVHGFVLTAAGTPLPNVNVGVGDRSAATDGNGEYLIYQWGGLPYTVTPALAGYTFAPANQAVSINSGMVHELDDFIGSN
ncbi:MAG: carboxypeptidase-like regulatory domain-containing protein, partial [candidate division WS1 bacterium]|nr:carboxypeptidase-like regulatory domain-containing protein [candidate division WS1 bacterium]